MQKMSLNIIWHSDSLSMPRSSGLFFVYNDLYLRLTHWSQWPKYEIHSTPTTHQSVLGYLILTFLKLWQQLPSYCLL